VFVTPTLNLNNWLFGLDPTRSDIRGKNPIDIHGGGPNLIAAQRTELGQSMLAVEKCWVGM